MWKQASSIEKALMGYHRWFLDITDYDWLFWAILGYLRKYLAVCYTGLLSTHLPPTHPDKYSQIYHLGLSLVISQSIMGYHMLSRCILRFLRISWALSGSLGQSQAIFSFLRYHWQSGAAGISETNFSISRPSPRLEFSESQFWDRVRDSIFQVSVSSPSPRLTFS